MSLSTISITTHYNCIHLIINSRSIHVKITRWTSGKYVEKKYTDVSVMICTITPLLVPPHHHAEWLHAGAVYIYILGHLADDFVQSDLQ